MDERPVAPDNQTVRGIIMTIRVIVWFDGDIVETDVFDSWSDAINWADGRGPVVEFLSQIAVVGVR